MTNEQIALCVQQKLILMTNILNLSKEIEVKCSQPEIELNDLLQKRKNFMDRIDMCNALLMKITDELQPEEKRHIKQVLDGKAEKTACGDDELPILQAAQMYNDYLQQAILLDKNSSQFMRKQYEEMKTVINQQRKRHGNTSMYDIR